MPTKKRTRLIIHPDRLEVEYAGKPHVDPAPLAVLLRVPPAPPRRVDVRAADPVVPRPVQVHALHVRELDVAALAPPVVVLAVPHPLRRHRSVLARRELGCCCVGARGGGGGRDDRGGGGGGAVWDGEVEEVEVGGGEVFGDAEFGGGADLWGGEGECHGAEGEEEGVGELHGWLVVGVVGVRNVYG